jgi:hypothetical protein
MKTVVLKYGCSIAGSFVPKGTELEVFDPLDERVQGVWPGIENRMAASAVVVQFKHLSFPVLIDKNQLS